VNSEKYGPLAFHLISIGAWSLKVTKYVGEGKGREEGGGKEAGKEGEEEGVGITGEMRERG
jgi:hypothetical protein